MSYKIGIIGVGNVGTSYAYSLINQGLDIRDIVLVDIDKDKTEGKALDLSHSLSFSRGYINNVSCGKYEDIADCNILCIAAGVPQSAKKTSRMEDIAKCSEIIDEIMQNVLKVNFNGIILVASNPLDAITYKVGKMYHEDYNRVIGTGTLLDTQRLRYEIAQKLDFPLRSISGYVFGEHGDSQFVAWSSVKINNTYNIEDYLSEHDMLEIEEKVKRGGSLVSSKQGYTCFGVANSLSKITRAIITNSLEELPVCSYDKDNKIYISSLTCVGSTGVISNKLYDYTEKEKEKYDISVKIVTDQVKMM